MEGNGLGVSLDEVGKKGEEPETRLLPLGLVRKQVNDLSCYYSLWRARTNWSVIV